MKEKALNYFLIKKNKKLPARAGAGWEAAAGGGGPGRKLLWDPGRAIRGKVGGRVGRAWEVKGQSSRAWLAECGNEGSELFQT